MKKIKEKKMLDGNNNTVKKNKKLMFVVAFVDVLIMIAVAIGVTKFLNRNDENEENSKIDKEVSAENKTELDAENDENTITSTQQEEVTTSLLEDLLTTEDIKEVSFDDAYLVEYLAIRNHCKNNDYKIVGDVEYGPYVPSYVVKGFDIEDVDADGRDELIAQVCYIEAENPRGENADYYVLDSQDGICEGYDSIDRLSKFNIDQVDNKLSSMDTIKSEATPEKTAEAIKEFYESKGQSAYVLKDDNRYYVVRKMEFYEDFKNIKSYEGDAHAGFILGYWSDIKYSDCMVVYMIEAQTYGSDIKVVSGDVNGSFDGVELTEEGFIVYTTDNSYLYDIEDDSFACIRDDNTVKEFKDIIDKKWYGVISDSEMVELIFKENNCIEEIGYNWDGYEMTKIYERNYMRFGKSYNGHFSISYNLYAMEYEIYDDAIIAYYDREYSTGDENEYMNENCYVACDNFPDMETLKNRCRAEMEIVYPVKIE